MVSQSKETLCSFAKSPDVSLSPASMRARGSNSVLLLGLDFGSTTSSALVARSTILSNTITGNMELGDIKIIYRSEIAFTPFDEDQINETQIDALLEQWFAQSGYKPEDFFAGGVIITGLAARQKNADKLAAIIEKRVGEILVATADDPNLESWLAFMGGCAALSRYNKDRAIVNLDIGGGTTNPAIGLDGSVTHTGCYFVGARHIQFVPGTYQIRALTEDARKIFQYLNIQKDVGQTLSTEELNTFLHFYIKALEHIAQGNSQFFQHHEINILEQVPFEYEPQNQPVAITFSGGVGELIYRAMDGEELPPTTFYGDLGVDLARAIMASPLLSGSLKIVIPENKGRATVYGLALHSTEVSGATLYLPHPQTLPLRHLPIVARLDAGVSETQLQSAVELVCQHSHGAALQILLADSDDYRTNKLEAVRRLGQMFVNVFERLKPIHSLPFVLLVDCNVGKSLGAYASNWGKLTVNLVVIDEVSVPQASFVNINKQYQQVVPISFYGIK